MLNRKGQNIAEYSILIALVIAAAVAMQVYVKRGVQGRIADAVDHAPDTGEVAGSAIQFSTKQYEPYYTQNLGNVNSTRDYTDNLGARGQTDRSGINERTGKAAGSYEKSTWWSDTAR